MVWGGRREEGSGWGTRVYLWWIHVDIWQNQYNIVKLKNKSLTPSDTPQAHGHPVLGCFVNHMAHLPSQRGAQDPGWPTGAAHYRP